MYKLNHLLIILLLNRLRSSWKTLKLIIQIDSINKYLKREIFKMLKWIIAQLKRVKLIEITKSLKCIFIVFNIIIV